MKEKTYLLNNLRIPLFYFFAVILTAACLIPESVLIDRRLSHGPCELLIAGGVWTGFMLVALAALTIITLQGYDGPPDFNIEGGGAVMFVIGLVITMLPFSSIVATASKITSSGGCLVALWVLDLVRIIPLVILMIMFLLDLRDEPSEATDDAIDMDDAEFNSLFQS